VDAGQLAEGFQSAVEAGNAPSQGEAGSLAAQAASELRAAAAAAMSPPGQGQPGQPGQPGQQPGQEPAMADGGPASMSGAGPQGTPTGIFGAFGGILTPAGRDWARVKGTLKSGVEGDLNNKVPEDYQELVREYFQSINRQTAESP
jgi:hypothetical protein